MNTIKLVVIGDSCVGKTCMLLTYKTKKFPAEYVPTVFDDYSTHILIDGRKINLNLWDTAGQEDYDRLRPITYLKSDIFLICFAISDPESFQRVRTKWLPELKHFSADIPFILVGTKLDLRTDEGIIARLKVRGMKPVGAEEALNTAREIGAVKYVECSALKQLCLDKVFDEAVRIVLYPPQPIKPKPKKKFCTML